MGTWGTKTFENDGASDWLYDLEAAASSEFLLKPLKEVVRRKGKADLDAALESLAAAEIIAAARHEPPKGIPTAARKWIRRVAFSPDDKLIALASKAVEKVRIRSELADQWHGEKKDRLWSAEVVGLSLRLKEALGRARPIRKAQPVAQRQTLAELIIEVSRTHSTTLRAELNARLSKLMDVNRPVGGNGLIPRTPLHWIASTGLVPEAQALVQRGAKIDINLPCMARPIGFAIENNRRSMIRGLLMMGADVNYAFDYAVKNNRPALAQLIYEHGVDLEFKDDMERTVSHSAAVSGADRSLQLLSKIGANLKARDENGETPLHYAAMFGNFRAVKKLLELKVDVNPVNKEGKTPLDFAVEDGDSTLIRLLRMRGGQEGNSVKR